MAKLKKTLTWALGVLVIGTIVVFVVTAVVLNMQDTHALNVARVNEEITREEIYNQEKIDAERVEAVRLYIGDIAADTMKMCYEAGYSRKHSSHADLSRRQVAECDHIMNEVTRDEARDAAIKAKKDAAYDKAHPAK